MVDRLDKLHEKLDKLSSRKKYGAAERAVDPKFEEVRDRFDLASDGVGAVQSTLSKVRSDQFSALGEPVATLKNFYQSQPATADTCSQTLHAIDDALVSYNVCCLPIAILSNTQSSPLFSRLKTQSDHQRACTSLGAYTDLLANIHKNIDTRDNELVELHKFKAQAAKGQVTLESPEREKQLRTSYEAANEQVKREIGAAMASRNEAFHASFTQICGMYARLFAALHTSLQPLIAAIPSSTTEPPPSKPLPPVNKPVAPPKPIAQPLVDTATTTSISISSTATGSVSSVAPARPRPPSPSHVGAGAGAPQLPPKPSAGGVVREAEAEPLRKPVVPEPVLTDDMDEETRAIVLKRYEEDKMVAEQKWVMMRKRRELEEQMRAEKAQRLVDDRRDEAAYEKVVREHQERMHAIDVVEAQETAEKEKRLAEYRTREAERHKGELQAQTVAHAEKDKADDVRRTQERAQEDEDRRRRFETWKKTEEERMRRELAARIRAQEEKERLEREELVRRRAAEDRAIASDREARDKLLVETLQEETQRNVQSFEAALLQEAKAHAEEHAAEREKLNRRHNDANKAHLKEMETRTVERNKKDFGMSEALAQVVRDLEDLERKEQREKVRRVEDDIERVERKERERREQDDLRRKAELEKIRRRQQELEELERTEEERRRQEDAKRAEMRQRILQGGDHAAPATATPATHAAPAAASEPATTAAAAPAPAPAAKPLPTPSSAAKPLPTPANAAPSSPLPVPAKALPQATPAAAAAAAPATTAPAATAAAAAPASPAAQGRSLPVPQKAHASPLDVFDPVHISAAQREQYGALFLKADTTGDGLVNGTEGRNFFQRSHLPFEQLGRIWKMADVDRDNKLSRPEFMVAMHLVYSTLKGHPLPAQLPPTLLEDAKQP